jgi:hypothetical protein
MPLFFSLGSARKSFASMILGRATRHRPAPMPRANNEEIYTGLLNLSRADQEELAKAGVI